MINVYLDDSYIKSSKSEAQPLIDAIGGIIIDDENEDKLINIIKKEKSKYVHPNLPIKWNFKDSEIKDVYNEFKKNDAYSNLIANSRVVRLNIFQKAQSIDYKIVFSCIKSFSNDKKIVKNKKEDFLQISFENILMRIGNEAKVNKSRYQIIMDWPADSNPKPYNRSYYYMYNSNKTLSGNNNWAGPLSNLNFKHSIFYTKCTHSPCLQFTDMVVGALKDYIEMKLDETRKNKTCVGSEAYDLFKDKIRCSESGKKIGWGIITPSGNRSFSEQISTIFDN